MKKIQITFLFSLLLLTACKNSSEEEVAGTAEIMDGALVLTEFHLTCEEARLVNYINLYRKSKNLNELTVSVGAVEASRSQGQSISKASDSFCQLKSSNTDNANLINAEFKSMGLGNNYGAEVEDIVPEPLDVDSCLFPTALPKC